MLAYLLPTPNGRVLWTPAPRFPWGELKGLGDEITVLSPDPDIDVSKVSAMLHDNIKRPVVRKMFARRWYYSRVGRMMLWGLIWLVGMDRVVEDLIGGLYLLIGLPLFLNLTTMIYRKHLSGVLARFNSLFDEPNVNVVFSPRLERLDEGLMHAGGPLVALERLDELGFAHLREFYRRASWSGRWEVGPPTGQGVLK